MKGKILRKQPKGQSIVEFVLVLPFLLLLFIGMVEVGYAMFHYIVVSNANREGVRLAARGRFTDTSITERIIGAGGFQKDENDNDVPVLSLAENFGVIITHIPFPSETLPNWQDPKIELCCDDTCPAPVKDRLNVFVCASGAMVEADGSIRNITAADSRIADINQFETDVDVSELINEWRFDEKYPLAMNEIVIVETYFAHPMLLHLPEFFPVPDPLSLYFSSSMRVTLNSRDLK